MEASPPKYTVGRSSADTATGSAEVGPPAYTFPQTFIVGGKLTKTPFVTPTQLKTHLSLLNAFAELKIRVEALSDADAASNQLLVDKERRWGYFVGLAVERFEQWVKALQPSNYEKGVATMLPPVDVVMVWHAYLLNPGWYAEDVLRIPALQGLSEAGKAFAVSLDGELGDMIAAPPSQERMDKWLKVTGTPFDPFDCATQLVTKELSCPKCRAVLYAPFKTDEGTGYLQSNFATTCTRSDCSLRITRDTLALGKFAQDLAKTMQSVSDTLAGTVHTPMNVGDAERGNTIKTIILSGSMRRPTDTDKKSATDQQYARFLMDKAHWQFDRLRDLCAIKMKGQGGRLLGRICSAYTDEKMFSVELVGAVLRQGSFARKMYDLKWTSPGFFDQAEDEVALQHAITRYHAFLDLMTFSPASFFVPTLDIDLAWHTHQLMAQTYSKDTSTYIGRFIDHDDKVEESHLATSFDITCRAWKNRFGVEYTHCGCPLPGDTIGQRLSRLVGLGSNPSYLIPPNRDDLLAATHASDHNAVFAFHHKLESDAARRRRRQKNHKRAARDAAKGVPKRGVVHDPAFLVPVPMYYYNSACGNGLLCCGCGDLWDWWSGLWFR
ncbi:hypothetical protein HMN09_00109400 [Mycena chlorophos]|uniref:Uncharacterized protein n=1 Tax=Mycena chlorophos TaxID=658473 RepID=A0A8H6TTZ2_MYCCL|nr:hypothetical protein HMN09_00109400 [Mycena chlorophos]